MNPKRSYNNDEWKVYIITKGFQFICASAWMVAVSTELQQCFRTDENHVKGGGNAYSQHSQIASLNIPVQTIIV